MIRRMALRYASKCADCGKEIRAGETADWDPDTKRVFCCRNRVDHVKTFAEISAEVARNSSNPIDRAVQAYYDRPIRNWGSKGMAALGHTGAGKNYYPLAEKQPAEEEQGE